MKLFQNLFGRRASASCCANGCCQAACTDRNCGCECADGSSCQCGSGCCKPAAAAPATSGCCGN
jgi:hypothetical protein